MNQKPDYGFAIGVLAVITLSTVLCVFLTVLALRG